jgi:hypothetical protein
MIVKDGSAGTAEVASVALPSVRCRSTSALRFTGRAFTTWGSILQALFVPPGSTWIPFDASAFRGVRFSVRATTPLSVRLKVPDRNTAAAGKVCTNCNDHFGAALNVGTSFTTFTLPFSMLTQGGYAGADKFPAIKISELYGFELAIPANTTYELWLDDVSFFR